VGRQGDQQACEEARAILRTLIRTEFGYRRRPMGACGRIAPFNQRPYWPPVRMVGVTRYVLYLRPRGECVQVARSARGPLTSLVSMGLSRSASRAAVERDKQRLGRWCDESSAISVPLAVETSRGHSHTQEITGHISGREWVRLQIFVDRAAFVIVHKIKG